MVAKFKKYKKTPKQSIFFFTLLGVLVIGVIGFLVFSNFKISQKRAKLNSQIESLRDQVQTLEQRKRELEAGISYQKTDEYLEQVAREKFNLESPGEQAVAFVKEKKEEEGIKEEKNFFEKFLDPIKSSLSNGVKKLKFW
jgi:cell division protein FtsB